MNRFRFHFGVRWSSAVFLLVLLLAPGLLAQENNKGAPVYDLEKGDQYITRIHRSLDGRPPENLQNETSDHIPPPGKRMNPYVRARRFYRGYRRSWNDVRWNGKDAVRPLLRQARNNDPEFWRGKDVDDYLAAFNKTMKDVRQNLARGFYRYMILYSSYAETLRTRSRVTSVKENGAIRLEMTITQVSVRVKNGVNRNHGHYVAAGTESNGASFEELYKPLRHLVGTGFPVTVKPGGNVLVHKNFVKLVKRARKALPMDERLGVKNHFMKFVADRILSPTYLRAMIYQSWARQLEKSHRKKDTMENFVVLPPLMPMHGLRKSSYEPDGRRDGLVQYEARENVIRPARGERRNGIPVSTFWNVMSKLRSESHRIKVKGLGYNHVLSKVLYDKHDLIHRMRYREMKRTTVSEGSASIARKLARREMNGTGPTGNGAVRGIGGSYTGSVGGQKLYYPFATVKRIGVTVEREEIEGRRGGK